MISTVTIEIDPPGRTEAEKLAEAQRVKEIFTQLVLSDGLNVKGGSATLHFDINGQLMEVEVRYVRKWKRRSQ